VPYGFNYIIYDTSWKGHTSDGSAGYKDGYADMMNGGDKPNGYVTVSDNGPLKWDDALQSYTYNGKVVDYSNIYVISSEDEEGNAVPHIGVFTSQDGSTVYTGNVYGRNNEVLMTVKDANGNYYSYWAAKVTNPEATMSTYRVSEYQKDLNVLKNNDLSLANNDINKVEMTTDATTTTDATSATIQLMRNGTPTAHTDAKTGVTTYTYDNPVPVGDAITVTAGGGTGGSGAANDTYVKLSTSATNSLTLPTGTKVEAIGTTDATTGLLINGEEYKIKSGQTYTPGTHVSIGTDNKINADGTTVTGDGNVIVTPGTKDTATNDTNYSVKLANIVTIGSGDGSNPVTIDGTVGDITGLTNTTTGGTDFAKSGRAATEEQLSEVKGQVLQADKYITKGTIDTANGTLKLEGMNGLKANVTGLTDYQVDNTSTYDAATNKLTLKLNDTLNTSNPTKTIEFAGIVGTEDVAAAKTEVAAGKNVSVTPDNTATDGHTKYIVDAEGTTVTGDDNVIVTPGTKDTTTNDTNYNVKLNDKVTIGSNENTKVTIDGTAGEITGLTNTTTGGTDFATKGRAATEEQLSIVKATAEKGWNITTGASTEKDKVAPGEDVNFRSANTNIGVTNAANNQVLFTLSDVLTGLNSITMSGTGVNNVGPVKLTSTGLSNGGYKITNVAAGEADTDAVNVSQLKGVVGSSLDYAVNNGTSYKADGNGTITITEADQNGKSTNKKTYTLTDVASKTAMDKGLNFAADTGDNFNKKLDGTVKVAGDGNINTTTDNGQINVNLNKNLTNLDSITMSDNRVIKNPVQLTSTGLSNGGYKITHVADGAVNKDSTDAVNGSQLNEVKTTAERGWNFTTGTSTTAIANNVAPGDTVNFSSSDGNMNISNTGDNIFFKLANTVTIGSDEKTKVTINGTTGIVSGLTNTTWDADDTIYQTSNKAATEAQLSQVKGAIEESSYKGWTLTTNKNKDNNKSKVDSNDIVDFSSADSNIGISNTGDAVLFTLNKDLINLDSITMSGTGVGNAGPVKLTSTGLSNGGYKITNVAAGEAETDAVNVSQLNRAVAAGNTDTHIKADTYAVSDKNKVTMGLVDKDGKATGETVTITDVAKASDVGDVSRIDQDLQNKATETNPNPSTTVVDAVNNLNGKVGDLDYNATNEDGSKKYTGAIDNGDSTTEAIGKLNNQVSDIGQAAKEHSSVAAADSNVTVAINPVKNEAGGTEYKVGLNKDKIDLGNVTIEGNNGNITANTVTAGKTSISDDGVVYDDKTYIDSNGINANGQKVTNVAAGELSETSTDAVNGSQLYATNQVVNQFSQNFSILNGSINKLSTRINRVGAGAAALASLHPLDFDPDAKWDFAAGYGNYRNANAVAVGAYYRPNEDLMFSVGGSMGGGENMVNAGVSIKLGSGSSHVTTSRVAMAKEIVSLRDNVAQLTAVVNQLVGERNGVQSALSKEFPDVPANHWAYEAVHQLASQGIIEGYPDGNFGGDRSMTRYEFATLVYRALQNGVPVSGDVSRLVKEFKPELDLIRVDTIAKDKAGNPTIQRVRVNKTK
jgi:hypothetical protein